MKTDRGQPWSREEVIRAMNVGMTFITMNIKGTGELTRSRKISLIKLRLGYALTDMDNFDRDLIAKLKAL